MTHLKKIEPMLFKKVKVLSKELVRNQEDSKHLISKTLSM